MRGARSMHEETHLMNSICNFKVSESKILECTCETTVDGGIVENIVVSNREFGAGINWNGCQITVGHTCTLDEIEGILFIREVKARGRVGDRDDKKMVERA
jgi:hypothetical protein